MPLTKVQSEMIDYISGEGIGYSFRNRVINGDFRIWQRGTSSTTQYAYLADRFVIYSQNGGLSASRSTDVPAGFKYSLSVAGSGYAQTWQRIEATNCADMVGGSITVSFYAKQTSGAGTNSLGVYLSYPSALDSWSGGTGTQFASSTFTATNSWARYSVTFSGGFVAPAGVANGLLVSVYANTISSATFLVTGVQVEAGTSLTGFERRPYSVELAMCQRYYEISSNLRVLNTAASSQQVRVTWQFKAEKRATPVVTVGLGATENITVHAATLQQNTAASTVYDTTGTLNADAEL